MIRLIFTRLAEDYRDWPSNPILHTVNVVNKYRGTIKLVSPRQREVDERTKGRKTIDLWYPT